jgi:hypothetical protein
VWQKFGSAVPELRDVALRLLSAHATSAAPERNWSLWGRVYCAARSALGMQRAKALIAICADERAKVSPSEAFEIALSVVEENVSPQGAYAGGGSCSCEQVMRACLPYRGSDSARLLKTLGTFRKTVGLHLIQHCLSFPEIPSI